MRRLLVLAAALGLALTAAVPVTAVSPHSAYDVHVLVSDGGVPADRVSLLPISGQEATATGGA